MKIYTRERKPALYGLLIFTVLYGAAFAAACIFDRGAACHGGYFALATTLYFAAVLAFLVSALIKQLQYNPYSYNTVYYFGFALFDVSLIVSNAVAAARFFALGESFGAKEAAALILNSPAQYMRLSLPFIVAFSVSLTVSNVRLIQKEGRRPANVLGIVLSFLLLAGEAIPVLFANTAGPFHFVISIFSFLYLYAECMLIGTVFANVFSVTHKAEYDKDYVLILGCRVKDDCDPTPLLKQRADAALKFASEQKDAAGYAPKFIPSGGRGADEPISEAECVARYLISRGVPKDDIILEDRSTDTLENMRFSFALTKKGEKCAFATTNYHVFRSGIASNRAEKHKAEGVGAKTKWYFWPNAAVREFAGLVSEHRGKQILIIAGLLAVCTALYFI